MQTEAPPELRHLSDSVEHLRSDLENIQRELEQSLGVWRTSLLAEKKEFQTLFQNNQKAWTEQDIQWESQRQEYEKKLQDIQQNFQTQIGTTNQNALRALNELDDSWQRDKLLWNQEMAQRTSEWEARGKVWETEAQHQKTTIEGLQESLKITESERDSLKLAHADGEAIWAQTKQIFEDKIQSLEAQVQESATIRHALEEKAGHTERDLATSQAGLLDLQSTFDKERQSWNSEKQALEARLRDFEVQHSDWTLHKESHDQTLLQLEHDLAASRLEASDRGNRMEGQQTAWAAEREGLVARLNEWEMHNQEWTLVQEKHRLAIERFESELTSSLSELAKAQAELSQERQGWSTERQALESRVRDLEARSQAWAAGKMAQEQTLEQFERDRAAARTELAAVQTILEEGREKWTAERNTLEARLNESHTQEQNFQQALEQWAQAQKSEVERASLIEKERNEWSTVRQTLEKRIQELESSLHQATQVAERQPDALQDLKAAWERDKLIWQHSLLESIRLLNQKEAHWGDEREKQDRFLQKLQQEVVDLQSTLANAEKQRVFSQGMLDRYTNSLESQVGILQGMVEQVAVPNGESHVIGHPMRRRTDLPYAFR